MRKAIILQLLTALMLTLLNINFANAAPYDQILQRWTKNKVYTGEDRITTLEIKATYYAAEFIEARIQKEAEANLWTEQEKENYRYSFLNALHLDEMIPVLIEFNNNADTMYLGPFDIMVKLRIGNKLYKPVDYDKRFNFKFQGKKEGLVFFRRFDEKTGKDLLKGVKNISLELVGTISPNMTNGRTTTFMWDIANDNPQKLYHGKVAARVETDRLLKRLEKLRKDKTEEEAKLASINSEISTIQARLDELAKQ